MMYLVCVEHSKAVFCTYGWASMCVSLSMTRTVIRFVSMAFFFSTHILFSLSLDFQDKDIAIVYFFLNVSCLYVCMYVCVYRPQSFYHHQYLSVEKTTTRVTSSPFFSLSLDVFVCFVIFSVWNFHSMHS